MPTPYIRHLRNRTFSRLRHSQNLSGWLASQAARLSTTSAALFGVLTFARSAKAVEAVAVDPDLANTVAPVATAPTGTSIGATLSVTDGTWTGIGPITFKYQWFRNSVPLSSVGNTHKIPSGTQPGGTYRCDVTATNPAGKLTVSSNNLP